MNYGGIISYIGIEYVPGAALHIDANDFHFRKLQLRASHAAPALYFPKMLQLLADGRIDGDSLISHVLPLEKIDEAMRMVLDREDDPIKVVITP